MMQDKVDDWCVADHEFREAIAKCTSVGLDPSDMQLDGIVEDTLSHKSSIMKWTLCAPADDIKLQYQCSTLDR